MKNRSWFLEKVDAGLSIFQAAGAVQAGKGQIVQAQGVLDHIQVPTAAAKLPGCC